MRTPISRWVATSVATLIVTMVLMVGADRLLGILGFPDSVPIRVAHPPHYEETRTTTEFSHQFRTNSWGLRYSEIEAIKPKNEYRVLMLGDSFTEGSGVEAEESFGALLEAQYNARLIGHAGVRFINGGLSGTGPLEYWRLFFNVGLKLSPDALMVVVMANDIENMPVELTREDLYKVVDRRQRTGLKALLYSLYPHSVTIVARVRQASYTREINEKPVFAQIRELAERRSISPERVADWMDSLPAEVIRNAEHVNHGRLAFGLLRPDFLTNNLDIDAPEAEAKWRAMSRVLDEIHKLSEEYGIWLSVVFVPIDYQYDRRRFSEWDPWVSTGMRARKEWLSSETEFQARLAAWTRNAGVPYLDLTPTFREASLRDPSARLNYEFDGHWTTAGHRLAAKGIGEWLDTEPTSPLRAFSRAGVDFH